MSKKARKEIFDKIVAALVEKRPQEDQTPVSDPWASQVRAVTRNVGETPAEVHYILEQTGYLKIVKGEAENWTPVANPFERAKAKRAKKTVGGLAAQREAYIKKHNYTPWGDH